MLFVILRSETELMVSFDVEITIIHAHSTFYT